MRAAPGSSAPVFGHVGQGPGSRSAPRRSRTRSPMGGLDQGGEAQEAVGATGRPDDARPSSVSEFSTRTPGLRRCVPRPLLDHDESRARRTTNRRVMQRGGVSQKIGGRVKAKGNGGHVADLRCRALTLVSESRIFSRRAVGFARSVTRSTRDGPRQHAPRPTARVRTPRGLRSSSPPRVRDGQPAPR